MRTVKEVKEILIDRFDPDDLIEVLNLSSEDIVNEFEWLIDKNLEAIDQLIEDML